MGRMNVVAGMALATVVKHIDCQIHDACFGPVNRCLQVDHLVAPEETTECCPPQTNFFVLARGEKLARRSAVLQAGAWIRGKRVEVQGG